jgi:putative ABC transport system ATP-binding protein
MTELPSDSTASIKLENVSKSYQMGQVRVMRFERYLLRFMPESLLFFSVRADREKRRFSTLSGGLDFPTEGKVTIDNIDITTMNDTKLTLFRREHIGFIFQFFNLIPTLTAKENVEFAAELVKNRRDPDELLQQVGLGDRVNHFPSELSGGENQRVAIARALATNPTVILCDEPTGSLDFETGKRIFSLLRSLNTNEKKTVIVVTHNSAIADIANRVVQLRDGNIIKLKDNPHPLDPSELKW